MAMLGCRSMIFMVYSPIVSECLSLPVEIKSQGRRAEDLGPQPLRSLLNLAVIEVFHHQTVHIANGDHPADVTDEAGGCVGWDGFCIQLFHVCVRGLCQ